MEGHQMTPAEKADFDYGFNQAAEMDCMMADGIAPHWCIVEGCATVVQYADEPACPKHASKRDS